jgi:hypothetical protein
VRWQIESGRRWGRTCVLTGGDERQRRPDLVETGGGNLLGLVAPLMVLALLSQ